MNLSPMIRLYLHASLDPHEMPLRLSELLLSRVEEPDLLHAEK